jgi:uncharacterized phage-like protein YoqJ
MGLEIVLGITGHRPKVLGCGYDIPNPTYYRVYGLMLEKFHEIKPHKIISGMALGSDQWAVAAAIELGIPFIAAIPFKAQDSRWPQKSKIEYQEMLGHADKIVDVSGGNINQSISDMMFARNKWIIDNSTSLLAVWNGERKGGTFSAVNYAEKKKDYKIDIITP